MTVSQRWLRVVFLATTLVFAGVALYVYAFRFFDWLDSDAAVPVVLGAKALHAHSPVVGDWFYANGDVWVFGPQLIAMLPVAIFGVGRASLLITVVLGFVLQLVGLVYAYARLGGERWVAVFAAMVTLMAWSSAHVWYVYVQLSYGFVTALYLVAFRAVSELAERASPEPWRFAATGLFVVMIAVQNPTRAVVYLVAPLIVGCLWPWRGVTARRRLAIATLAVVASASAFLIYKLVLARAVTFSVPRGHLEFMLGNIRTNLATLARGLVVLLGGGESGPRAVPGAVLLVGAIALATREVLVSRDFTALRLFGVVALAQLVGVLVPLVIGNLLESPDATRYLMPSTLMLVGLAVVIAIRTVAQIERGWTRRLALGWLVLVPVAAVVAAPQARPRPPKLYEWPDSAGLAELANTLVSRGLTRGFSLNNLGPTLLTLESGGATMACPIYFRNVIMPQRWLTDTECYANLPERFYVVTYRDDRGIASLRATLPTELETFRVRDYEVHVYRTADTDPAWLDLPILDGESATFPMRLPATHLQLARGKVAVEAGELVATGEPGTVLYGPYLSLPKGSYEVTWIGNGTGSAGRIAFSVTMGNKSLARPGAVEASSLPRGRGELARLSFKLDRARDGIEFPVESGDGGRVSLHELVIEKKP